MVELLQRGTEKNQLVKHVMNVVDQRVSLSEVSDRALSNFGNLEQCSPIMHGMDMINTQMFPEVSSSSVSLKQQEVVNFFKEEDTMINAFQSLVKVISVSLRAYLIRIFRATLSTLCFGKFFIKNIDQPVEVLETMITHYQVAEVVGSLTLSSRLFHVVSLPLFVAFCIPLLQQGNMVSCLEAAQVLC